MASPSRTYPPPLQEKKKAKWLDDTQEAEILPRTWANITRRGEKLESDTLALALHLLVEKEKPGKTIVIGDYGTQRLFFAGRQGGVSSLADWELEVLVPVISPDNRWIVLACSDGMIYQAENDKAQEGEQKEGLHWGLLIVDKETKEARFLDSAIKLTGDESRIFHQYRPVEAAEDVVEGIRSFLVLHNIMREGENFKFIKMMYTPQQGRHNKDTRDTETCCGAFVWGVFKHILMMNALPNIDSLFPVEGRNSLVLDSKAMRKAIQDSIALHFAGSEMRLPPERPPTPPSPAIAYATKTPSYGLDSGRLCYHDGRQTAILAKDDWTNITNLETDVYEDFLPIALDILVESMVQSSEEGSDRVRSGILVISDDEMRDIYEFGSGYSDFSLIHHLQILVKDPQYRYIITQVTVEGNGENSKDYRGFIIVDKAEERSIAQILDIQKGPEFGDDTLPAMSCVIRGIEALLDDYDTKDHPWKSKLRDPVFNRKDRKRLRQITLPNTSQLISKNIELSDVAPTGPFVYGILRHFLRAPEGLENIEAVVAASLKDNVRFDSNEFRWDMKHRVWWKCMGRSFESYKPHEDAPADPSLAPPQTDPVVHSSDPPPALPPTDDPPSSKNDPPPPKTNPPPPSPSSPPHSPMLPNTTLPGGPYNAELDIRQVFHDFARHHTIPFHELSDEAIDEWIEVIRQAGLSEEHQALRRSLDDDDDGGEDKKQEEQKEKQKEKEKEKEQKDEPQKRETRQSKKAEEQGKKPAKKPGIQPKKPKDPGKDPEKKTEAQIEYEDKMKKKKKIWKKRAFLQKVFGDIDDLKFIALHQWRKTDPTMVNSKLGVDITRAELQSRRPDVPFNINYTGVWSLYPRSYLQWFLEDVERIIRLREPGIFPDLEGWQNGDNGRPSPDDKDDKELRNKLVNQWFDKNPKSGGKSNKKTAQPVAGKIMNIDEIIAEKYQENTLPYLSIPLKQSLQALNIIKFERHPDLDKLDQRWDASYKAVLYAGKQKTFSDVSDKDCLQKWVADINVFTEGKKEDDADFSYRTKRVGNKTTYVVNKVYRSAEYIKEHLNECYCSSTQDPLDDGDDDGGGGGGSGDSGGKDEQHGRHDGKKNDGKDGKNGENSEDGEQGEKSINSLNAALDQHQDLIDLLNGNDLAGISSWVNELPEDLRIAAPGLNTLLFSRQQLIPIFRYNTYIFELMARFPGWTSIPRAVDLVRRIHVRSFGGAISLDELSNFLNDGLLGPVPELKAGEEFPKHPNLQIPDVLSQTGRNQRGRKRSRETSPIVDQPAPKKTRIDPPRKEALPEFATFNGIEEGAEVHTEIESEQNDVGLATATQPTVSSFTPINRPPKRYRSNNAIDETGGK